MVGPHYIVTLCEKCGKRLYGNVGETDLPCPDCDPIKFNEKYPEVITSGIKADA